MKKKLIQLCLLMIWIILSGCSIAFTDTTESIVATDAPTESIAETDHVIPETTAAQESDVTETTVPDLSLHMNAGSYLLKYEDQNTSNYLEYYLFIPDNAQLNMPLIVFLHGDGEVGKVEKLENYGMIAGAREIYGEDFPFIAISPCTRIPSWTEGSIPETLIGLIESTITLSSADRNRIIITGHSRGAMGVWSLINTYGDYFSAAVPVNCGSDLKLDYERCATVPVLAIAGTSGDMEIEFQNQMRKIVEKLTDTGGNAQLTLLEGAQHKDTAKAAFTEETFRWILQK